MTPTEGRARLKRLIRRNDGEHGLDPAAEFEAAQEQIVEMKETLRAHAERVAARERELESMRRELERREQALAGRTSADGGDDRHRERELDVREEPRVTAGERDATRPADDVRALDALRAELEERDQALARREHELAAERERVLRQARELAEAERRRTEAAAGATETPQARKIEVERREALLAARERELADGEVVLQTQRADLEARSRALDERERRQNEDDLKLADARTTLEQRERALHTHAAALEARRQELIRLSATLVAERRELEARERRLSGADQNERSGRVSVRRELSFSEGLEALSERNGALDAEGRHV